MAATTESRKSSGPKKPKSAPSHPPFLDVWFFSLFLSLETLTFLSLKSCFFFKILRSETDFCVFDFGFLQMITEAIVTLKEKTGSSQYAITKYSEEKHKHLPTSFRKLLLFHLKKLVASGKLVKVKNSFKLAPAAPVKKSSTVSAPAKPKSVAKPKATKVAPKAKKVSTKPKPKAKAAAAVKPKAKSAAAKPKPKTKVAAKAKPVAKPKAKVARTSTRTTPSKKAAPAKKAPKPKSVKSPAAKKKAPARKAKK